MLLTDVLLAACARAGLHSCSAAQEVLIALGLQLTADQEWQLLTASEHPLVANRSPPSAFTSEPFALEPPPPEAAGAAAGAAAAPPAYPGPALPAGRAFRASIVGFGSNGALAAAAAAAAAAAGAAAGPASPERPYQQLARLPSAAPRRPGRASVLGALGAPGAGAPPSRTSTLGFGDAAPAAAQHKQSVFEARARTWSTDPGGAAAGAAAAAGRSGAGGPAGGGAVAVGGPIGGGGAPELLRVVLSLPHLLLAPVLEAALIARRAPRLQACAPPCQCAPCSSRAASLGLSVCVACAGACLVRGRASRRPPVHLAHAGAPLLSVCPARLARA